MNVAKLRSRIYGKYESQAKFARTIKWHPNKVSAMLKGKYTPDVDESDTIASLLQLTLDEYSSIFLPSMSKCGDKTA